MTKMRKAFTWTNVYDRHLIQMKAQGVTCADVAEFINHNVSLGNETNKHNIALITAQDVRDRHALLQKSHTLNVESTKTTVKHMLVTGGERTIAVSLPLVQIRA